MGKIIYGLLYVLALPTLGMMKLFDMLVDCLADIDRPGRPVMTEEEFEVRRRAMQD